MSKKSHHFLTLWPWPLTYDLEKLIRSGHHHYQFVYQIWEQSIPWFLSYRVNTIAGGGRLRRKTITSPDPSDMGDIITTIATRLENINSLCPQQLTDSHLKKNILCINFMAKMLVTPYEISMICVHKGSFMVTPHLHKFKMAWCKTSRWYRPIKPNFTVWQEFGRFTTQLIGWWDSLQMKANPNQSKFLISKV